MHIWHALLNRRQPKRKDEINKHARKMKSSHFGCLFLCITLKVNHSDKLANAIGYGSETQANSPRCVVKYDE